ncbi:hypothetical protein NQD34_009262 [Periophthalmus magnuspinnatus]|uniref:Uncharacterized protein n=1 Tax=Periophthalmus magnuspinnatus TaxID=409849 RepID=A0A3B3Z968_9GOBI|nr:hypothetical protein NQD34_009262 [Periophthalmus magnuspinnatus]
MSKINVSLDNPYGHVTIPRAKLQSDADGSTVIANPAVIHSNGNSNPYASPAPEVREVEPEEPRCRACCYRCRRK